MGVEKCGCVWEDEMGLAPCPRHRPEVERMQGLAWKISARRGVPYDEAYRSVVQRMIATFVYGVIESVKRKGIA